MTNSMATALYSFKYTVNKSDSNTAPIFVWFFQYLNCDLNHHRIYSSLKPTTIT